MNGKYERWTSLERYYRVLPSTHQLCHLMPRSTFAFLIHIPWGVASAENNHLDNYFNSAFHWTRYSDTRELSGLEFVKSTQGNDSLKWPDGQTKKQNRNTQGFLINSNSWRPSPETWREAERISVRIRKGCDAQENPQKSSLKSLTWSSNSLGRWGREERGMRLEEKKEISRWWFRKTEHDVNS